MLVESKIAGSAATQTRDVPVPEASSTLRDVLAVLVRHELAQYERRRQSSQMLRILTPADLARGVDTGVYGREARALAAPVSEQEAIARAVEAFSDGLFFVFCDQRQIEDLDALIDPGAVGTMRLVRLVALAGG